ncbi:sigma-70 family RNA polymerase sigma factor [Chitinophaga niabensis]|uniref:sigma-70 family RNA polymerase sigma factor n=1 Tax=Chitinophaga niabensis TaxID=536979 RepID=UPI0031BB5552
MSSYDTIISLKNGDEVVFKAVFFEHHQRVYNYVLKKTNSTFLAEETRQLSFLKLWNYRHTLDENIPLLTQLFRIVRTTMIDQIRKEQTKILSLENLKAAAPGEDGFNPVSEQVEENDLKRSLAAVLNKMPVMQKKVFEMNRFQGMSYREISLSLSISVKTVETHISRALKFLKQHLSFIVFFLLFQK